MNFAKKIGHINQLIVLVFVHNDKKDFCLNKFPRKVQIKTTQSYPN